jgi:hypothetical protein
MCPGQPTLTNPRAPSAERRWTDPSRLAEAYARADLAPEESRNSGAESTNEMVRLLGESAYVVLDPNHGVHVELGAMLAEMQGYWFASLLF